MKSQRFLLAALLSMLVLLTACGGSTPELTAEPQEATPVDGGPHAPVSSDDPTATPDSSMPAGEVEIGTAVVDTIDILILESFPVQIQMAIRGNLPDGCTQIGEITQSYDEASSTFTLDVSTTRPKDMMCTQALVPYEQNVALDGVIGLKKGTYTVIAKGVSTTFELQTDNGPLGAP